MRIWRNVYTFAPMIYINDDISGFDFNAALPLLSEQRRLQALSFKYELGRKTCAAAYLLLCEGLQKEYGITEPPLFEYGEYGKPHLIGHPDIHFSLSHCKEAALCVISDRPVGADIESIRHYNESLARYTMNENEMNKILGSARPDVEFIRFWTQKEAVCKLSGKGISNKMTTVLKGTETFKTVVNVEQGYVYSVIYSCQSQDAHRHNSSTNHR